MDIKKAKNIINDIIDICSQLEDPTLTEACSGIYNDVQAARTIEEVISSARELMVFVHEAPWKECDLSELLDEIEEGFNELMEEYDEF